MKLDISYGDYSFEMWDFTLRVIFSRLDVRIGNLLYGSVIKKKKFEMENRSIDFILDIAGWKLITSFAILDQFDSFKKF